jgi:hypothetical protein
VLSGGIEYAGGFNAEDWRAAFNCRALIGLGFVSERMGIGATLSPCGVEEQAIIYAEAWPSGWTTTAHRRPPKRTGRVSVMGGKATFPRPSWSDEKTASMKPAFTTASRRNLKLQDELLE